MFKMFIVKLGTFLLFVSSGLYNSNCAMVDGEEKQYQSHTRVTRQSRPILNGIVFLIATNLLAKQVQGLATYQPPASALQGSLYLNFGRPNQPGQATHQHQQYLPYNEQDSFPYQYNNYWTPMHSYGIQSTYTTPKPQPVQQHQIINIHDSSLDDSAPDSPYQEIRRPSQHVYIEKQVLADAEPVIVNIPKRETIKRVQEGKNKVNNRPSMVLIKRDTIDEDKEEEEIKPVKRIKVKPVTDLLRLQPQQYELINKLAVLKRQSSNEEVKKSSKKNSDKTRNSVDNVTEVLDSVNKNDLPVTAKQVVANTTTSTTTSSTTTSPTTTSSTTETSTTSSTRTTSAAMTTTPANNMTTNETGGYYYGNYTGNENVSITTPPPGTMVGNITTNTTSNQTTTEGYYYYPGGEYGPSNGNENISITYGPPTHYEPNRPFYPSQIDHYYENPRRSDYDAQHYDNTYYHHDGNYYHDQQHHHQHHQQHHTYHHDAHNYHHNPHQNTIQQFNDAVQKFYNKYDYHYPYFKK